MNYYEAIMDKVNSGLTFEDALGEIENDLNAAVAKAQEELDKRAKETIDAKRIEKAVRALEDAQASIVSAATVLAPDAVKEIEVYFEPEGIRKLLETISEMKDHPLMKLLMQLSDSVKEPEPKEDVKEKSAEDTIDKFMDFLFNRG
jgi:protein subunit release factor A